METDCKDVNRKNILDSVQPLLEHYINMINLNFKNGNEKEVFKYGKQIETVVNIIDGKKD